MAVNAHAAYTVYTIQTLWPLQAAPGEKKGTMIESRIELRMGVGFKSRPEINEFVYCLPQKSQKLFLTTTLRTF